MHSVMRVVVMALGLVACSVPELDAEGKSCPCAPGFTCVDDVCQDDGPTGDAGRADASRPTPMSCAARDTLFCSGFEDGFLEWSRTQLEPAIDDGVTAAEGERSLVSGNLGDVCFADLGVGSAFFLRAWMYVPATTPIGGQAIMLASLDNASASLTSSGASIGLDARTGRHPTARVGVSLFTAPTRTLPLDEWFCLEVEVRPTGVQLYLDDAPVFPGPQSHAGWASPVNELIAGAHTLDAGRGRSGMRVDAIVVDDARIGCE